ncbi:MAG: hypothetical protein CVU54_15860 [Deltaproteobacteria bacterium HGW-Deltaproteobacteria-12]|jgi:hypothetical protein|nr:MAG: hypothetical protein CVU54_15860 [Deltaproteobacteria bacterium HGW-Deltaproteobacteria-12]
MPERCHPAYAGFFSVTEVDELVLRCKIINMTATSKISTPLPPPAGDIIKNPGLTGFDKAMSTRERQKKVFFSEER